MNAPKKNWLEWAVFAVSLGLVLTIIGYLVFDAVTMGDSPPMLTVELGDIVAQTNGFAVPVTVTNNGDETAENVQIQVVLTRAGAEAEQSELSIAFVPRRSSGKGWATFRGDPQDAKLEARVLGYEQP